MSAQIEGLEVQVVFQKVGNELLVFLRIRPVRASFRAGSNPYIHRVVKDHLFTNFIQRHGAYLKVRPLHLGATSGTRAATVLVVAYEADIFDSAARRSRRTGSKESASLTSTATAAIATHITHLSSSHVHRQENEYCHHKTYADIPRNSHISKDYLDSDTKYKRRA